MDKLIDFSDTVSLCINNKIYNFNKQILLNSLDYFKTLYSTNKSNSKYEYSIIN